MAFIKRVLLLKSDDFLSIADRIYMPTQSEMSAIRAREGQYKRDVGFHADMSKEMVKTNLEEAFPYLKNKRFFCAAKVNVNNDSSRFEFHGEPHLWDGSTIRRTIQGNSTLYVLEGDQSDSSGISDSEGEHEIGQEELSDLIKWMQDNVHFEVNISPKESSLEGGNPCRFTFNPKLHPEVTSGSAIFENVDTVHLDKVSNGDLLGTIPASPVPGLVTVKLFSQHGIYLGQTVIKYYGMEEVLKQIVFNPNLTKIIFEEYNRLSLAGTTGQTQHSGILGITDPVQLLSLLVYTAAKVGAQQFLEIIFNTSSGRVVFDAYKERSPLPEAIAKQHGHEETARYLKGVTKRFSKEIRAGKECSKTIDWPELVKAAEAAEKRLNTASEEETYGIKKNVLREVGYLGDVDTSSESSQRQSSDSEEDISKTLRKVSINDQQECEIQQPRDRNRDTKDQLNDNIHKKKSAEEVKDSAPLTGSHEKRKHVLMEDDPQKMTTFSDLSEAQKQRDRKDLKDLQVKTRKFISKAEDTVKSHRAAADKLDATWSNCRKARATGSIGGILGGCFAIGATVMTGGLAAPLMFGMAASALGAATTVGSGFYEASVNSSETKKAEKELQETKAKMNEVNSTVESWLVEKEKRRLLYICYQAQMTLRNSDPAVIGILQNTVVPHVTRTATPMEVAMLIAVGWTVIQAASMAAVQGGAQVAARAALGGAVQGAAQVGVQAAGKLVVGVSAVFVAWELINLSYTINEILQDKGSEAAKCLRQRADVLEKAIQFNREAQQQLAF